MINCKSIHSNSEKMKRIFLILPVALLLITSCKYFKKAQPESFDTLVSDTTYVDDVIDSAAYYGDVTGMNEPVIQQPQVAVPAPTRTSAVGGTYYMIVGCFTVQQNADRYAEKLRGMGYNPQIISGNDNFQMVAAKTYGNYRESVSEIEKFRNEVTPNAWVYRQR